ncbi:MAG TPA: hypothetical protein VLT51_16960 [Anaerolineales bacterium]|nr:hypothetical protein [Anaerolineales bacterium]
MKCPNCQHTSNETVLLHCSQCGEAYERGPFEEFQHLEYLAAWLSDRSEISLPQKKDLLEAVEKRRNKLLTQLLPGEIVREKPVETKPVPAPVVEEMPKPKPQTVPAPASIPKPVIAPAPKPAPPSKQIAPPKPKRPPVDWKKVREQLADAVTSGALLRALLYLGAFMIVISATVLVVRFWNQFNPVLQMVFIASVPLMFYSGGWLLRSRLKLIQGGTVLTGIGAILVAVDFAAIYQFGGLAEQINGPAYWLGVSLFCTALYAFTAWRLKGEFFDYLTLISSASVLVALTRIPKPAPALEWTVVTVTFSGMAMTYLAGRFWKVSDAWHDFARASRYLSQILIPASVFYVLFSPADFPIMSAFLVAAIGYAVLAWKFPNIVFAYSALIASIGAVIFGLRGVEVGVEWYALAASVLALVYILAGRLLKRTQAESNIIQNYVKALNTTGLLLIGAATASGSAISFFEVWAGVLAMTVATLDLAVCAYLFKHTRYTFLASSLFTVPFSVAVWQWFIDGQVKQPLGWLTVAWAGLALAYIGLGMVLRKSEGHASWFHILAHGLTLFALGALPLEYLATANNWSYIPGSTTLGLAIALYLASAVLHDSGRHPALSKWVEWMPLGLGKSIFLWFAGLLFPIWITVGWHGNELNAMWLGTLLTGFGIAYIGIGQWLFKHAKEYRLPFHLYSYFLFTLGILLALPNPDSSRYPLLISLIVTFVSLGLLAYIYNRVIETTLASVLFIWLFVLSLELLKVPEQAHGFAGVLLASFVYTPFGIYLNKFQKSREGYHLVPVFVIGYALSVYAIYNSILWSIKGTSIPWVGAVVPLIGALLYIFSASHFRDNKLSIGWAWASAVTLAVTFRQALTLFHSPNQYDPFSWIAFAALYMIVERILNHVILSRKAAKNPYNGTGDSSLPSVAQNNTERYWFDKFHMPLVTGVIALAILGLTLSLPDTIAAFRGIKPADYLPFIIAQVTLVVLVIASARLYHTHLPLFIEPALAFLPVTLFFIGYGESLFGKALTTPQYAFVWTGLGVVHIIAAILTDKSKERYSHGLYLGGYVLLSWSVLWSMIERSTFVWSFGLWILAFVVSALLVHFGRHQTWDEFIQLLFGKIQDKTRIFSRNIFQWLAAWTFPVWCVIFLREMNIPDSFAWLGLVVPPLAYLGLALWFRRVDSAYASPLQTSAHFFTVIGLLITIPATIDFLFNYNKPNGENTLLAFIVLQSITVIFYTFSAWMRKSRFFAHVATWLSIGAFSMAWQAYGVEFTPIILIVPWLMWSAVLLAIGYVLDKNKARYSHGPYLGGYALMTYALILSTSVRLTNIYALALSILLAIASYLVVHFGRHHTFEDFVNKFWHKADETTRQIASTIFLFYAAYAIPVLLTQYLAHIKLDLAWRGVTLAITAPLYIAVSLLIRRSKSRSIVTVPTWATYSAGYALTAIGAMISFGDERLAIYVLALNAVVYAASAYIFRQPFWLYLTTALAPIVTLLTLSYTDHLETQLVAWTFMAFAFVYLAIGQVFDRAKKTQDQSGIHPFATPFYMPGFLLSAIALALASNERMLAIEVYSAGVVLYALSSILFRETLFYYPAAWLAAVPYYLAITLTSLETRWYGLAWLPLILIYIGLGRFVFHKRGLAPLGQGPLADWLTHPAVPFHLLAYALSISMISLSYASPLPLTIAFGIAATIYFISAYLFKNPAWIYPALFAAHMTVLAYFTINPSGGPMRHITLPFLAMTWLTSLVGYAFERKTPLTYENKSYRFSFLNRLFGHSWARPFFAFAIIEMVIWQSLALTGYDTALIVASGHALLLALFSLLWTEGALVYGAVAFSLLAVGTSLKQAEVQFADAVAVYGGIGFGLYLLGRILDALSARIKSLTVWLTPLTHASITLTALAILINLPTVTSHMTATAAAFASAGALYVSIAYRGRMYRLGYFGMALLELAWVLALVINDVGQPQWYAIPGGLYFIGLGYLEWSRNKSRYAVGLEILGLGLLFVTSFAQSLNGENGLPYFALLMAEGLIVIWWGVYQKRKIPFFTGIGASAVNIVAQVIVLVNVYDINRWFVAFGAGLLIMGFAIYIERSREQLRTRARELSETLEKWE